GLLGAKIWSENRVDFAKPVNLVPIAAGIIIAIGDTRLRITDDFVLSGIALGTIVALGAFHLARLVAPAGMRDDGAVLVVGGAGPHDDDRRG
ncbi:MAG: nitrate reductase, partial [Nocardioidaceae bacterium]